MKVVAKGDGLPPLPTSDLALYSRKSPPQLAVQKLASFIANAVDRWENEVPRVDCLKNSVVLSVQRLGSNDHAYS
jgi:hypothetical protein